MCKPYTFDLTANSVLDMRVSLYLVLGLQFEYLGLETVVAFIVSLRIVLILSSYG